ncbi:hypothetical protein [Chryseobacterium sp. G0201]|uniref:hypothetical protein n=1 Tax=Chryseobacterium sp. G0201 TaxID=2487065 RepID=UPI000F50065E|nr:hypothetical protein [Chryseobacterium sp. G0201]AZA54583.1 hypothetical protein EG348_17070 [Chryseobacterium sp. G0201]
MKINKILQIILLNIILTNCNKKDSEIYVAIENFDNSLDYLITQKTYNKVPYLVFQADTLKNNPVEIIETCYLKTSDKDSMKIDANCHIYKFANNELFINVSEDQLGNRFVQKNIYFSNKIDNELLDKLRRQKSDTIYIGNLKKYDNKGNLVKMVRTTEWKNIQSDGLIVINDNRLLEVYSKNKDGNVTPYRKEYFNKKYNVDSLKNLKVEEFATTNLWDNDKKEYLYKFDKYGNWIEKKKLNSKYPEVYYRTYKY